MYEPRHIATRRAMEASTVEIQKLQLDESGERKFDAMNELLGTLQRSQQAVKDSFAELDKSVAKLNERLSWIKWLAMGTAGVLAYVAKVVFEWQLKKL